MKVNYRNTFIRFVYIIIDIVCICLAIFLACKLRPETIAFKPTLVNVFWHQSNPFRYIFVSWVAITLLFLLSKPSLYQTRREMLEGFEITLLIRSILFSSLGIVVVLYVLRLQEFPRSILIIGASLIALFLSIWRILKRLFVEYLVTQGYNKRVMATQETKM